MLPVGESNSGSLQVRDKLGASGRNNAKGNGRSGGIEDGGDSGHRNVNFVASSKSDQSGINVITIMRLILGKEVQERAVILLAQLAKYDVAREGRSGDIKQLTDVGVAESYPSGATVGVGGGGTSYAID